MKAHSLSEILLSSLFLILSFSPFAQAGGQEGVRLRSTHTLPTQVNTTALCNPATTPCPPPTTTTRAPRCGGCTEQVEITCQPDDTPVLSSVADIGPAPNAQALVVSGTACNDNIKIVRHNRLSSEAVHCTGDQLVIDEGRVCGGSLPNSLYVYGAWGNDKIDASEATTLRPDQDLSLYDNPNSTDPPPIHIYIHLYGGPGDDIIKGSSGNDIIFGDSENDRDNSRWRGGNDCIDGGEGADTIHGGPGDDIIHSQEALYVYGEGGNDHVTIEGCAFGGSQPFQQLVDGGDGDDWLWGQQCTGHLKGGGGNDHLIYSVGIGAGVTVDGGPGRDVITSYEDCGGEVRPPDCNRDNYYLHDCTIP